MGIGSELKGVLAHDAEAIFLIEPLSPRVIFPDAEPHNVAALVLTSLKTSIHQVLADTAAEEFQFMVQVTEYNF